MKELLVMEKLSSHPLLQCRPNFVSSLSEFVIFVEVTLDDLNVKIQTLKAQKKILRQNRNYTLKEPLSVLANLAMKERVTIRLLIQVHFKAVPKEHA